MKDTYVSDGGKKSDGTRLSVDALGFPVLLILDLAKLAWNWLLGISNFTSWILFAELSHLEIFLVILILLGEELQEGVHHFSVLDRQEAAKVEHPWGWVLIVDLHHALNTWDETIADERS